MPNRDDDSWFHEASATFFSSLRWATIIIVVGAIVVYLVARFF
jgi:hypothetical protein